MELRADDIREIVRVFADSVIEELRIEIGDTRLQLSKQAGTLTPISGAATPPRPARVEAAATPVAAASAPDPVQPTPPAHAETSPAGHLRELRSPLLGVFYRRPAPGEPPFVDIGSQVGPEDPVCIVDVMKMFTRVPAGIAGRIAEICVEDGQLVQYGQVLMRIDPT